MTDIDDDRRGSIGAWASARSIATEIVVLLLVVSALVYLLLDLLPGDAAVAVAGPGASEETLAVIRGDLGLDRPLPVRYLDWLGSALTGDLGSSARTGVPVAETLWQRLPLTLEIVLASQLLAIVVAVPLGLWLGRLGGTRREAGVNAGLYAALSFPAFSVASLLIYVFAVRLAWFPVAGYARWSDDPVNHVRSLVLPVVSVSIAPAATYVRILAASVQETLRQPFIVTARAGGLGPGRVLARHALRPSLFPLVTSIGLSLAAAIGGTIIVEQMFGLPGLGQLMIESIALRELRVVQGITLIVTVGYVVVTRLVDALYGIIDSRTVA